MRKTIVLVLMVLCMAIGVNAIGGSVWVDATTDLTARNVDYTLVNQQPDPAEPGSYVEVRWKVEGFGQKEMEDVEFELIPEYPFTLDRNEQAVKKLGDVGAGLVGDDGIILHYKLRVNRNAVEGRNSLRLRFRPSGGDWYELGPFDVRIQTHDSVIYVSEYTLEPEMVAPGDIATVKLKLENKADSLLKDIKLTLSFTRTAAATTSVSYEDWPFSPVGTTDELFLKQLSGGRFKEVEYKLKVDPDAEAGVYKLPLTIAYSDELAKNYTKTNTLGITVGDTPDVKVDVDETEIYKAGQKGAVTLKFVNKGLSDIKFLNVMIKDSKDFILMSPPEVYIGNIDSDDYESTDVELYLKQGANGKFVIPISYDFMDATNMKYKKEDNVEVKIYTAEEIEKLGLIQKGNGGTVFIVILILIGSYFAYRWWKKRRRKVK